MLSHSVSSIFKGFKIFNIKCQTIEVAIDDCKPVANVNNLKELKSNLFANAQKR